MTLFPERLRGRYCMRGMGHQGLTVAFCAFSILLFITLMEGHPAPVEALSVTSVAVEGWHPVSF